MRIAILGAESTGKSTLAQALHGLVANDHGPTQLIPEYLRGWCDQHGRTPLAHEQWHIAHAQSAAIQKVDSVTHCVSDTTALMTAVYSDVYFGDTSLYEYSVAAHQGFDCTLVMGLDLPWVADGLQRDSEAIRRRCDATLRRILAQHNIPYTSIYGTGSERTAMAYHSLLQHFGTPAPIAQSNWKWNCEKCSDADCEHRIFSNLLV